VQPTTFLHHRHRVHRPLDEKLERPRLRIVAVDFLLEILDSAAIIAPVACATELAQQRGYSRMRVPIILSRFLVEHDLIASETSEEVVRNAKVIHRLPVNHSGSNQLVVHP
jgi:hypothetical protein